MLNRLLEKLGLIKRPLRVEGEEVDLVQVGFEPGDMKDAYVCTYYFEIQKHGSEVPLGNCDLRVGHTEELYYAGNIGYYIKPSMRGHRYAEKASLLLLKIAMEKGMDHVLITCSPDNTASRCTILKIGGVYEATVDVPSSHWLYRRNERIKEIYRIELQ